MGMIEKKGRKRKQRRDLKAIILRTTALAGVVAVAAIAPNTLAGLKRLGLIPTEYDSSNIGRARRTLVKKGLLVYDGSHIRLTPKGELELRRREAIETNRSGRRRKWDGRWRVLIFDIPEHRRALREKIRRSLGSIGFERLQDSVWAYPYDCEDFVTLLKADYNVGKQMLYMIVDELEYDSPLRRVFGLPEA